MSGYAKAAACAIAAVLLIGAGWKVEGWRAAKAAAEREQEIAQAEARGAEANLARVVAANARSDKLQAALTANEAALELLTKEKNDAIRRLTVGRRCLDGAAVRVLNQSVGQGIQQGPIPQAVSEPVSTDAAFATDTDVGLWIGQCQRGYDTCRGRLQAIHDFYEGEQE